MGFVRRCHCFHVLPVFIAAQKAFKLQRQLRATENPPNVQSSVFWVQSGSENIQIIIYQLTDCRCVCVSVWLIATRGWDLSPNATMR